MSKTALPVGAPAPRFTLNALGSGRTFKLAALRGRIVLLLFVDHHTAYAARDLVERLRRAQPDHEKLTIAVVLDLHSVPKLLRSTAERFIEGTYTKAAALIPPPYDPADHLIMLPDWTGKLFEGYHIGDVSREIAAVIIDEAGVVTTVFQASDLADQALAYLAGNGSAA